MTEQTRQKYEAMKAEWRAMVGRDYTKKANVLANKIIRLQDRCKVPFKDCMFRAH